MNESFIQFLHGKIKNIIFNPRDEFYVLKCDLSDSVKKDFVESFFDFLKKKRMDSPLTFFHF